MPRPMPESRRDMSKALMPPANAPKTPPKKKNTSWDCAASAIFDTYRANDYLLSYSSLWLECYRLPTLASIGNDQLQPRTLVFRKNGEAITFCRLPAHLLWIMWGKAFFCCDYVSNLVNFQVQKSYHSSPWMGGPQAKLLQQLPNKGWHW